MKLVTKTKVLKLLSDIQIALEKCGGRGGTPGPCPHSQQHQMQAGRQLHQIAQEERDRGKKPPKKPTAKPTQRPSSKPAVMPKGGKPSAKVREQSKKVRTGQYDLNTVSGTVKYFASQAVGTVDKAISKVEKFVGKLEAGKAAAVKKLDAVKAQKSTLVKEVTSRISRIAGLFTRIRSLAKSASDLDMTLANELEKLADSIDKVHDLANNALRISE